MRKDPILQFGCPILGGMAGGLIAFPVASQSTSFIGPLALLSGVAAGILMGYRRRDSRPFLYFGLFVVITLLTLIIFQM